MKKHTSTCVLVLNNNQCLKFGVSGYILRNLVILLFVVGHKQHNHYDGCG
jgi:hypothetical protein